MTDTGEREGYHVLTCESRDDVITVPIPDDCKPLSCSVQAKGGATGLLASFYNPEAHTWVVHHAPVDIGAVTVIVKVLALMDPHHAFTVHIAATAATEGAGDDELFELGKRSFLYNSAREARPENPAAHRSWPPNLREAPEYPRDLVCLAAPLPFLEGYVLCGGGFVSDYPVYTTGPAMPIATDLFYDRVVSGDPEFFDVAAAVRDGSMGSYAAYEWLLQQRPRAAAPQQGPREVEYAAWSVTAAPNAGLMCFAIGIRSRELSKGVEESFASTDTTTGDDGGGVTPTRPRRVRELLMIDPAEAVEPLGRAVGDDEALGGSAASQQSPEKADQKPSSTPNARGRLSTWFRPGQLMSPSQFPSTDSETSSLDSLASSEETYGHTAPLSKSGRHSGREVTDRHAHTAALEASRDMTTPHSKGRGMVRGVCRELALANCEGGGALYDHPSQPTDAIMEERRQRKEMMRMVTLRRFLRFVYRPNVGTVDVRLPPPFGALRVRYGLCQQSCEAAERLFYRKERVT